MLSLGEYGTCSMSIKVSNLDFVIVVTAINDAPPCGGYPTDSGAEYKVPGSEPVHEHSLGGLGRCVHSVVRGVGFGPQFTGTYKRLYYWPVVEPRKILPGLNSEV